MGLTDLRYIASIVFNFMFVAENTQYNKVLGDCSSLNPLLLPFLF